eukprot:c15125_g1_i1.p1 GENE.c15125_g1_i1~~c15125_g1_i1.p1  ORF type:complete len:113 (+),score=24.63 c15125_g1_i1:58-396(+)
MQWDRIIRRPKLTLALMVLAIAYRPPKKDFFDKFVCVFECPSAQPGIQNFFPCVSGCWWPAAQAEASPSDTPAPTPTPTTEPDSDSTEEFLTEFECNTGSDTKRQLEAQVND